MAGTTEVYSIGNFIEVLNDEEKNLWRHLQDWGPIRRSQRIGVLYLYELSETMAGRTYPLEL